MSGSLFLRELIIRDRMHRFRVINRFAWYIFVTCLAHQGFRDSRIGIFHIVLRYRDAGSDSFLNLTMKRLVHLCPNYNLSLAYLIRKIKVNQ